MKLVAYRECKKTTLTRVRRISRKNLNDYSAKIKTPITARNAVKPKLTEEAMASLVGVEEELEPVELLELVELVDELELEFLAAAKKFAKVWLPVPGALIAKTIPEAQ